MKIVLPLIVKSRTTLFVTDTSPIISIPYGAKIPNGVIIENRNEKTAYNIGGLYLVDYTVGNTWCEGSVTVAR